MIRLSDDGLVTFYIISRKTTLVTNGFIALNSVTAEALLAFGIQIAATCKPRAIK